MPPFAAAHIPQPCSRHVLGSCTGRAYAAGCWIWLAGLTWARTGAGRAAATAWAAVFVPPGVAAARWRDRVAPASPAVFSWTCSSPFLFHPRRRHFAHWAGGTSLEAIQTWPQSSYSHCQHGFNIFIVIHSHCEVVTLLRDNVTLWDCGSQENCYKIARH